MIAGASLRIVLAGGGTGGHIFPGLALAEELSSLAPDVEILFAGSPGGLEERLVPEAGRRLELLPSVKRRGRLGLLKLPLAVLRARRAALGLFSKFNPNVVVALGGYAALAPGLAARSRRVPLAVLEQNAVPGRVSRFLARFADEVHVEFAESVPRFARPGRVAVTGNPVRQSIIAAAEQRAERTESAKLNLLVLGGSQGARRLNELFLSASADLEALSDRLRVVHLTGQDHYAAAARKAETQRAEARRAKPARLEVTAIPFEKDMARLYAEADLILSRAGATAMAEIAVCGLPSILVPFPYAKDNHQEANARSFQGQGAARVLLEPELDGPRLADEIRQLIEDAAARSEMAARMKALGRPHAGAEIARRVLLLAEGKAS